MLHTFTTVLTTNFGDVFKSNFLENVTEANWLDIAIALILAFAVGLFIFAVYKKTYSGVLYSQSFGVSLLAMTLITTMIILAVTSNIILSLGMVGALSIVRFRTAIKEPLDIVFLFWSISEGIILGAGLLPLALIGAVFIGLILLVFVNRKSSDIPYILIVNCDDEKSESSVNALISESVKKYSVKSKSVSRNGIELTLEVRIGDGTTKFVNKVLSVDGVNNAVLVSYNGEYMT